MVRCIGTILSVLCCFFLSEIPQLRFTHVESILLSESLVAGKEQLVKGKLAKANLMVILSTGA